MHFFPFVAHELTAIQFFFYKNFSLKCIEESAFTSLIDFSKLSSLILSNCMQKW